MNDIPEGFTPADFTIGFLDKAGPYYLKKDKEGRTIVGVRITKEHINYVEVAHGGVMTTMADVILSLQVHISEKPNLPASTISLTTNFLSGAKIGEWVEGVGTIDRIGKKLAYTHGSIWSGDRTIMTMTGVFNIMRPSK